MITIIMITGINFASADDSELSDCKKMNGGDNWNKGLVVDLQEDCFSLNGIDCSNVSYSTNFTKTLAIMKFCTGGEEEVK